MRAPIHSHIAAQAIEQRRGAFGGWRVAVRKELVGGSNHDPTKPLLAKFRA